MALVDIGEYIPIPNILRGHQGTPAFGNTALSAAGRKQGFVFRAPKTGSIRGFYFRVGTVTTGGDCDCRLEQVDATTGLPNGTLIGTTTNVTKSLVSGDANTYVYSGDFTLDASVTRGDVMAVVINNTTGSYQATFITAGGTTAFAEVVDPYLVQDTTGSAWAKAVGIPVFNVKYSDGTTHLILNALPVKTFTQTTSFNNTTNPDEIGAIFTFPFACRIVGAWFYGSLLGDVTYAVYDGASAPTTGSALATIACDKDITQSTSGRYHSATFATTLTVAKNDVRRMVLRPDSATSVTINEFEVDATLSNNAFPCGTWSNKTFREKDAPGTFDDTSTLKHVLCGFLIDQIDDGAGTGGPLVPVGTTGGARG
jgi:hypothetical protein